MRPLYPFGRSDIAAKTGVAAAGDCNYRQFAGYGRKLTISNGKSPNPVPQRFDSRRDFYKCNR